MQKNKFWLSLVLSIFFSFGASAEVIKMKKKSSAKIASTKESFQKIMHNILIKKPKFKNEISKEDKLLLDKWVGNSDGKSNERLISALKKELY